MMCARNRGRRRSTNISPGRMVHPVVRMHPAGEEAGGALPASHPRHARWSSISGYVFPKI